MQLALQNFSHCIQVLIKTNNTTVQAYINKQGSLWSSALQREAEVLFSWAESLMGAIYAPGGWTGSHLVGVDWLSRWQLQEKEWQLNPEVLVSSSFGTNLLCIQGEFPTGQILFKDLPERNGGSGCPPEPLTTGSIVHVSPVPLIQQLLKRIRQRQGNKAQSGFVAHGFWSSFAYHRRSMESFQFGGGGCCCKGRRSTCRPPVPPNSLEIRQSMLTNLGHFPVAKKMPKVSYRDA